MKKTKLAVEKAQLGKHWESHGCKRGPGNRESVEGSMQMHHCGRKMRKSQGKVSLPSFLQGLLYRQILDQKTHAPKARFSGLCEEEEHTFVYVFSHPAEVPDHAHPSSFPGRTLSKAGTWPHFTGQSTVTFCLN